MIILGDGFRKKYFTLICYDSRNTIYISWFLQRKSQAYSFDIVCDKSCHTFSTYMPRCNIWLNNNRNKPAYTSLSLQVLNNFFFTVCLTVLVMVVWRIWYWITSKPLIDIFFYSHHLPAWYSVLLSQSWEFWKGKSFENYCNLQFGSCFMASLQNWISRKPKISWFS